MNSWEWSFIFPSMCNEYTYNNKYTLYLDNSLWVGARDKVQTLSQKIKYIS